MPTRNNNKIDWSAIRDFGEYLRTIGVKPNDKQAPRRRNIGVRPKARGGKFEPIYNGGTLDEVVVKPRDLGKEFLNSPIGRLYQNDKPLKNVYPEFVILSGLRGGLPQISAGLELYNNANKARIWLTKEMTREAAKRKAKQDIGWGLFNMINPFRNGGIVRPKARGGRMVVDMSKVGRGAERDPRYYIDNTMNPLDEVIVSAPALTGNKAEDAAIRERYYNYLNNGYNSQTATTLSKYAGQPTAFDGSLGNFMEATNALSGGVLNRFSPTQNGRFLYDLATGGDWRNSWMGNNGVVLNNEWAKEHPYLTMAANGAADVGAGLLGAGALGVRNLGINGTKTLVKDVANNAKNTINAAGQKVLNASFDAYDGLKDFGKQLKAIGTRTKNNQVVDLVNDDVANMQLGKNVTFVANPRNQLEREVILERLANSSPETRQRVAQQYGIPDDEMTIAFNGTNQFKARDLIDDGDRAMSQYVYDTAYGIRQGDYDSYVNRINNATNNNVANNITTNAGQAVSQTAPDVPTNLSWSDVRDMFNLFDGDVATYQANGYIPQTAYADLVSKGKHPIASTSDISKLSEWNTKDEWIKAFNAELAKGKSFSDIYDEARYARARHPDYPFGTTQEQLIRRSDEWMKNKVNALGSNLEPIYRGAFSSESFPLYMEQMIKEMSRRSSQGLPPLRVTIDNNNFFGSSNAFGRWIRTDKNGNKYGLIPEFNSNSATKIGRPIRADEFERFGIDRNNPLWKNKTDQEIIDEFGNIVEGKDLIKYKYKTPEKLIQRRNNALNRFIDAYEEQLKSYKPEQLKGYVTPEELRESILNLPNTMEQRGIRGGWYDIPRWTFNYKHGGKIKTKVRPKAKDGKFEPEYGNWLDSVIQRNNSIKEWGKQGVERVAKQARQAERKVKADNQIKTKVPYKENRILSISPLKRNLVYKLKDKIRKEIVTNPAMMAIDDAIRNLTIRQLDKRLGINTLGNITYTENDFPERKLNILDSIAKSIVGNRKLSVGDTLRYNFAGQDYDDTYLSGTKNSSVIDKLFNSNVSLGKSIGGGQMTIYNNGYDVTDVYDFDPNVKPKINGLYPLIRRLANYTNASEKDKDTHKNKIHIHRNIYLGK